MERGTLPWENEKGQVLCAIDVYSFEVERWAVWISKVSSAPYKILCIINIALSRYMK